MNVCCTNYPSVRNFVHRADDSYRTAPEPLPDCTDLQKFVLDHKDIASGMTIVFSLIIIVLVVSGALYMFYADIPDVEGPLVGMPEKPKRRRLPQYKGPKTDERINRMLAESIELLEGLGVPISKSVSPDMLLTSAHAYFGVCWKKGAKKNCQGYDYYIGISGFTLNNTEKNLRNTLIHELIHTVPGGLTHGGAWKKWADYVSEKTEYRIQRVGGDMTEQDSKNLREGCQ